MDTHTAKRPVEILLVEDNPADARLVQEMVRDEGIRVKMCVVKDGVEALDYLLGEGEHTDAAPPDLLLLDLNLRKKDGREVLAEIKADRYLRRIPVVVLTASKAEEDIAKAYDLHANCYITKPVDLDEFSNVIKAIKNFWLSIVELPDRQEQ
ncbi:MAG: response regulator [Candidatus Eisenbacteria bacterium]